MKALIIGQGSIGQRHAQILREMGFAVSSVSRHLPAAADNFNDLPQALQSSWEYVVVANASSDHHTALLQLAKSQVSCPILVEKPLFHQAFSIAELQNLKAYVGYQLRFHPLFKVLKDELREQKILSTNTYVGQNLRMWRRNRSYEQSYSAFRAQGGGVLRDLSHEFDYLLWLVGDWQSLVANGGKFSDLQIDSEDVFSALFISERSPVNTVEVNYLDRGVQRRLTVNALDKTYLFDLVQGTLKINEEMSTVTVDRNDSYRDMHQAALRGLDERLCTIQQGLEVMCMVEAMENSSHSKRWVKR